MLKHALLIGAMSIAAPALAQTTPPQTTTPPIATAPPPPVTAPVAPPPTAPAVSPAPADPAAATADTAPATPMPPAPNGTVPAAPAAPVAAGMLAPPSAGAQVADIVNKEFPSYDKNRDGKLTRAEFGAWTWALRKAADPKAINDAANKQWTIQAFGQADSDKSKSVSKDEMTNFLAQGRSKAS